MSSSLIPPTQFGRKISKDEAQRLYKNFVKIKKRSIEKLRSALPGDDESARFHSGLTDANGDCCFLDNMFVFDKPILANLLGIPPDNIAVDGVVAFFGSRDKEDSPSPKDANQYIDVDGRPTLIIFPFTNEIDGKSKTATGNMNIALDNGYEHPGTGGGPGGSGIAQATIKASSDKLIPIAGELPSAYNRGDVIQILTTVK